ncbi:hypothetical protein NSQ59_07550 [Margalitia sp. FSL K6-0131]|uniref:hypothetical protein n=1 Tax=Margalitia sp. FSL K6-0131 TaxID=2954604 RepID=UPI0030FC7DE2
MDHKWVKIYNYKFNTPKLDVENNNYQEERFDEDHLIPFILRIMDLPLQNRIYDTGDKVMTLESFQQSDDADFYEGCFTSARYGAVTNLVHRRTFAKRQSDKTVDEGDENNIYFVIERATGRLFLQSDGQRLVTRNSIDTYLRNFLPIFNNDMAQLNRQIQPLMITPGNLFTITTIYSESFFEEIGKLVRIKKATMQIKYNQDINSDVVNAIRAGAEGVAGADTIEYSIINKERGGSMRRIEQFIRNLEELDKYEKIVVEGSEESGRTKAIKIEDHPKDFSVKVNVNQNGIISFQELIDGIIDKVKRRAI